MPRRPNTLLRQAAGDLGTPYLLRVMGGPMRPVHMAAGSMWIDPAARPRRVTVVVDRGPSIDDDVAGVRVAELTAVRRKSGWRVYGDRELSGVARPSFHVLETGGPLDPRDEGSMWCWGWTSVAARALRAAWALR